MGTLFSKVRHWAFKQIHVLGRDVKDVKRESRLKFGITVRHFNGIRYDLDQAVEAWSGGLKFRIQTLNESIEQTDKKIAGWTVKLNQLERLIESKLLKTARFERQAVVLRGKIPGKKRRLDILKGRLSACQRELAAGRPRICFGGRSLLRSEELWKWKLRRESRIFLVGSKDESFGNQSCQWFNDSLQIRLPDGKFATLSGVKFRYGQERLLAAVATTNNQAISWLLFRADDGLWHAHATITEAPTPVKTSVKDGVVAIDVNIDHLAVTIVDRYGNPTSRLNLGFPDFGTSSGEAAVIIGDSVKALCFLASSHGYGVACEDLEFSKKKASLREQGKNHARRLSGWSYAKFFKVLEARCHRDGIALAKVKPHFTSIIGKFKYAACRAMSTHHAAALAIGRLAQGYGEKLVAMDGAVLTSPARMRPRTERRRWRAVRRLPREDVKVSVRTAGSVVEERQPGSSIDDAFYPVIQEERRTGRCQPPAWGAVALASNNVTGIE